MEDSIRDRTLDVRKLLQATLQCKASKPAQWVRGAKPLIGSLLSKALAFEQAG